LSAAGCLEMTMCRFSKLMYLQSPVPQWTQVTHHHAIYGLFIWAVLGKEKDEHLQQAALCEINNQKYICIVSCQ
jgi:hypothetical protein